MKLKFNTKIAVIVLIFLGLAVYANTLRNGMFWDDNDFILNNAYVQSFSFVKFFSENLIAGAGFVSNYWRPVLLTVFSLEWHLFHNFAAGYHFVNMATHIADGILLFYILLRSFGRRGLAFAAAAIFLVHPLATEAVSYANSLGDSLSVFFMFSGILLFQKGQRAWPALFYVLALMSKETAIIMPGLLFLVAFFSPSSGDEEGARPNLALQIKFALIKIWPYLLIAGAYVLLRATTLNFQNSFNLYNEENFFTQNIWIRILTFFRILVVYFGLMFWPADLHMERGVQIATSFRRFDVMLGAVIFLSLLACALLSFKKFPVISFGLFWFLIGIAPTSNIAVPINGLLYEHWLYLPLIGIFLAAAYAVIFLVSKYSKLKIPAVILFGVAIAGFAGRAIVRNTDWHDPIRFYNKTLAYSPDSTRVWNNLGMSYADASDVAAAERAYKQALTFDPKLAPAIYNLGNLYRDQGRTAEAISQFQKTLESDPHFYPAYRALLNVYLREKKYPEVRELVERELQGEASDVLTYVSLWQVAKLQGDYPGALQYLDRALALDPNYPGLHEAYLETKSKVK